MMAFQHFTEQELKILKPILEKVFMIEYSEYRLPLDILSNITLISLDDLEKEEEDWSEVFCFVRSQINEFFDQQNISDCSNELENWADTITFRQLMAGIKPIDYYFFKYNLENEDA